MAKLAFPSKRLIDDWNPHIVRHVRTEIREMWGNRYDFLKMMYPGEEDNVTLELQFDEWIRTWNSAQEILNNIRDKGVYPLAYRLDPQLSKVFEEDPIEGSKFGGVPDFRHDYSFEFRKDRDPEEIISSLWPNCGGCGKRMNFLGGVNLGDWMAAIHLMTANNPTHTYYGSKISNHDIHYYQHSGLGFGVSMGLEHWPLFKPFLQIFYCEEPHFENPAFDSRVRIEQRHIEEKEDGLMDVEAYRNIISEFVDKNRIRSNIPIQALEGLVLKFDIDILGKEFLPDWLTNLDGKYNGVSDLHPEIFGKSRTPYQFFGHPHSQQTEKRFVCQNGYLGPHRMAPIVNWTEKDRDFSYQIYGCLKCQGRNQEVYCKTDGSCT